MARENLTYFEINRFNSLVGRCESAHRQAQTLTRKMRTWRPGQAVPAKERSSLANWCRESNDTRNEAREIAREISMLVFERVLNEYD